MEKKLELEESDRETYIRTSNGGDLDRETREN